eukprot:6167417-Prymnesium_polylepis.1
MRPLTKTSSSALGRSVYARWVALVSPAVTGLRGGGREQGTRAGTRKRLTQCHARSCMFCDSMCATRLTWGRCRVSGVSVTVLCRQGPPRMRTTP